MSPLKKIMVIKPNIKSKLSTTKPTLLIQVTQKLYQNPSLDEFKFISRQGKQNSWIGYVSLHEQAALSLDYDIDSETSKSI